MKKVSEMVIQIPVLKKPKSKENRIEFHKNKIVPQRASIFEDDIVRENEWQQEYYIIYNSYVLDEKESDN